MAEDPQDAVILSRLGDKDLEAKGKNAVQARGPLQPFPAFSVDLSVPEVQA